MTPLQKWLLDTKDTLTPLAFILLALLTLFFVIWEMLG